MSPHQHSPARVFVVLNPTHRASRRALAQLRRAAGAGTRLTILETTVADPGPGQARQAVAAGAEVVIVCGGDGTVRLVAGVLAGTDVRLGILPTGTANLFARNAGLRPLARRCNAATALHGAPRAFDVGWSRHRRTAGWSDPSPFLVLAGIGHDAAAVLATGPGNKRALRWAAYLVTGLRHLARRPVEMELVADDRPPLRVRTWCVLAGNCGRLPFGIQVFPDARPDDGALETLVVPLRHPGQWAWVAAKGLLHLRRDVPPLRYGRAQRLTVRPSRPVPLQLDGDAVPGVLEAQWWVAPAALLVNSPRTSARGPRRAPDQEDHCRARRGAACPPVAGISCGRRSPPAGTP